MKLAPLGIEDNFDPRQANAFRCDLGTDHLFSSPPFNDSDWFRKEDYVRWHPSGARLTVKGSPPGEPGGVHQFGVPPKGNANFAQVQHIIDHPAPGGAGTAGGMAGILLANASMQSNQSGERVSDPKSKLII